MEITSKFYLSLLTRDGALSDFELLERVRFQTRLYLVPYKSFSYVSTDLSYSHWIFEESIRHRFNFINGKLESYGGDYDKEDLPQYNLNSKELIAWLRETLNVPFKEIDSDEDILEKGINQFLDSYLWYGKDEYDWKTRIKNFKDWKSFRNDYLGFMKEKNIDNNGSSSFYGYDGFKGNLNFDKNKYGLIIVQKKMLREEINRTIKPAYYDDESLVFEYRGDEVFKKAFELFGFKSKQLSLLDFM